MSGGDFLKKIICICLSLLLALNSTFCVYADEFGGSSGSIDTPTLELPESYSQKAWNWMLKALYSPYSALNELYDKFSAYIPGEADKEEAQKALEENTTYDGTNYYINANFFKTINQKTQDNIHALDGYWLYTPIKSMTPEQLSNYYGNKDDREFQLNVAEVASKYTFIYFIKDCYYVGVDCANVFVVSEGASSWASVYDSNLNRVSINTSSSNLSNNYNYDSFGLSKYGYYIRDTSSYPYFSLYGNREYDLDRLYGSPFKVFYSKTDLKNYLNKGLTYAPSFPEINITIPKYYIDNSTNLPDIDLSGINIEGKAEADIQAQLDLAMKNYFDKLLELSTKPTNTPVPTSTPAPTSTPTPTKKPDISITPTPKPGITDIPVTPTPGAGNIDLTDTNNWLEKIYKWLEEFGKSHDTLAQTITDYIEKNDGKLDEIITAIDSLSKGEVTPEENGCKYDFTALSDFLTSTWNESDKKLDTMIELLEQNNRYQQQLVSLLGDIKAELVKENVISVFKNRSSETANKAKEKFPTSIPWDVAMIVNSMSAEPQEINLTIPVKIDSLHIDEKIHIDITGSEWEKLAKTCRYLLSILFILYLIHLSRKLFYKGDDD